MNSSILYLIPTLLGNDDFYYSLPNHNLKILNEIDVFLVENEKSARKFIKTVIPAKKQSELEIYTLNKDSSEQDLSELSNLFSRNIKIGILSEAGLPAVADPGGKFVKLAHHNRCRVIPLIGPSSILLALMASGLNGQNFSFHGYLPIDKRERKRSIQKLESESKRSGYTQIFMETPYRNNSLLEDLIHTCNANTNLCVAANITLEDEYILTQTVKEWSIKKADFHKKPAIFLLKSD